MLANRVREFTTTVGTGDITLGGSIAGHVRFTDAFVPGDSVIYVIEDGENYEIGTGTFQIGTGVQAGGILQRTDISETLNAGSLTKTAAQPLDLSGQARIYCAATAKFLLERDLTTDVIREVTPGAGVTVGSVLLKDGTVAASAVDITGVLTADGIKNGATFQARTSAGSAEA
ncbi:MAG: hypothetical protein COB37_11465 [Kordiimonadales bacterium]|nr:MAG: hypothetical protein COB37_11465 [Kordiimonadales bacterium]